MAKSNSKVVKTKALDLGALQDEFVNSRSALVKDADTLQRATDRFHQTKKWYENAETALKEGTKAVLG